MRAFDHRTIPKSPGSPVALPLDRPLSLEIGGGAGLFAVQWAQSPALGHLITIERHKGRFEKLCRRLENNQVGDRVTAVRDNAVWWITHNLPKDSIEQIFLMYPNPYPKHPNRRWARMPFMAKLLEVLKPGGTITITTNEPFYAAEAREFLVEHWRLALTGDARVDEARLPRSHFERKFLASKQPCWELNFTLQIEC